MGRHTSTVSSEKIWLKVFGTLNEYQARLFVAERALDLGRGGITRLARLTGMSRVTITQGVKDLSSTARLRSASSGRVRNPGGGRKKVEDGDPALRARLKEVVEETTHGPTSPGQPHQSHPTPAGGRLQPAGQPQDRGRG